MTEFVDIKVVDCAQELNDALEVRRKVFVEEQKIAPSLEFDGNDFCATHIVAYVDKKPVGTMRIRYFKDFVKFERISVLQNLRKSNISDLMMKTAVKLCAQKGYETVHGVCKKELLPRWAKDGAFPIKNAKPIIQNGMELIPIEQKIPQSEKVLNIQTSLDVLNKKEGQWFESSEVEGTYELLTKTQLSHMQEMKEKVKDSKKQGSKEYISPKTLILKTDSTKTY
ncbi:MAG: hypothetical protein IKS23_01500 [Alphaproteobacteria bacterium]|nr:hypothetical protein [Alphaproteobacteria bacterium]